MRERGEIFADEAVIRDVYAGGMGVVYICEGRLRDIEGTFAVKTCHDIERHLEQSHGASFGAAAAIAVRRRFVEEALAMLELPPHPNLVSVLSVQQEQGMPYIVMEYVDGGNLRRRMQKRLEVADVLRVGIDVARGVRAAYESRGLVHRDLKPENILLTREGRAKVADFGLAIAVTRESIDSAEPGMTHAPAASAAQLVGTLPYIAPEQLSSDGSPQSDVYAIGVILYELLAGRVPFPATSAGDLLKSMHASVPPALTTFRDDVPVELATLITECLAKRPGERPAGYRALLERLEAIAKQTAVVVPAERSLEPEDLEWVLLRKVTGLLDVGRVREARAHLDAAGDIVRDSPRLLYAAATALADAGEHARAIETFDRALRHPSPLTKRILFNKGNTLMAMQRTAEAARAYGEAVAIDPAYAFAHVGLAAAAFVDKRYGDAIAHAKDALRFRSDDSAAWSLVGRAQLAMGRRDDALETLRAAETMCARVPTALLDLAQLCVDLGDTRGAAERIERFLATSPMMAAASVATVLHILTRVDDEQFVRRAFAALLRTPAYEHVVSLIGAEDFVVDMRLDGLVRDRKFGDAAELVHAALNDDAASRRLLLRKAQVLTARNEYAAAERIVDDLLRSDDRDDAAHFLKGLIALAQRRFAEAIAALDKAASLAPDHIDTWINRASAYLELRRGEDALESVERSLDIDRDHPEAMVLKARILGLLQRTDDAAAYLKEMCARHPYDVGLLHELAKLWFGLRRHDDALRTLERILAIAPKNVGAWHNKGEALLYKGKISEALVCYRNAVAINPALDQSWVGIGTIHLMRRDYQSAIMYLKRALAINEKNEAARGNLIIAETRHQIHIAARENGWDEEMLLAELEKKLRAEGNVHVQFSLERLGQFGEEPFVVVPPDMSREHDERRERAFTLSESGRIAEAILLFKRVVRDMPTDYASWHALGVCYDLTANFVEAIAAFDAALNVVPAGSPPIETFNSKGEVLRKLGRFREAIELYDKVLAVDDRHEYAWNNKGLCLKNLGRYDEAKECYARAIDAVPASYRALINRAMLDFETGDRGHAKKIARQLEAFDPKHAYVHFGLGTIYANLGQIRDAKRELRIAREMSPHDPEIVRVAEIVEGL